MCSGHEWPSTSTWYRLHTSSTPSFNSTTGPCCEDERQWSPASGQTWTTLGNLSASHTHSLMVDTEDSRIAYIQCEPPFAINQTRECSLLGILLALSSASSHLKLLAFHVTISCK